MRDEPLDLIPLTVLLGIVVAISMGIMIPMYREAQQLKYDVTYDKVVTSVEGQMDNNEVTEGYSYTEMVLLISKQTYFMPQPRVIDIGGQVLAIQPEVTDAIKPGEFVESGYEGATTNFIPENTTSAALAKSYINTWCTKYNAMHSGENSYDFAFDLRFTTGTVEGESDDCYTLYVLAKTNPENETIRLRCLANGQLEEKPNLDYDIMIKG